MTEIAWGLRVEDKRIVGVDQVPQGLACGCICPECHYPLVAAKGEIYQHHFRHQADNSHCEGGQETALHQLAKRIVAEASDIRVPTKIGLPADVRRIHSAEIEPWMDGIRPDVLVRFQTGTLAVEIMVHHKTAADKIEKMADRDQDGMEIDLSIYRGEVLTEKELIQVVLYSAKRVWLKKVVHPGLITEARPRRQPPHLSAELYYGGDPDTLDDRWNKFQAEMAAWKRYIRDGDYWYEK